MPTKKKSSSKNSVPVCIPSDASLYTAREAGHVLRLSESTIRAWILHKQIPYIKLHNKSVRILRSVVDALITASVVSASPKPAMVDEQQKAA